MPTPCQTRESNMELLRILAMLLVLGVHFCGAALSLPNHNGNPLALSQGDWWKLIVESVTIIGVNIFVLISGWFGIKTRWQGLWRFTLQTVFYSSGVFCVFWLLGYWNFNADEMIRSLSIYTRTYYWFVPAYFGLMLLAPLLNVAIEAMTRRTYTLLLSALAIVTFYAGWIHGLPFSDGGYSTANFILLYLIARYIRIYLPQLSADSIRLRTIYIALYLLSTISIFLTSLYTDIAFKYNSPFVILAAINVLLLFSTMRFKSRIVNWIATSAFSVYLLHMHPLIWIRIKNAVINAAHDLPYAEFTLWCIGVMTAIFATSVLIDKIRIFLLRPLEEILAAACRKLQNFLLRLCKL